MQKNLDFSGKRAIVTGGTRGIGDCIVKLLLEYGCEVIASGTGKEPPQRRAGVQYEQLDFTDPQSYEAFSANVVECLPGLDILVNNAGINKIAQIDEVIDEDWERIIAVNLTGAMRLTRVAARVMKRSGGGRILNISSIFGVVSREKRNAYTASKTGLIGLTRSCALDLAPFGILVNALCPGFTRTDLTTSVLSENEMTAIAADVPLGRFAEVDEIALTAGFLCSDMNSYMTGQAVVIDGGFVIR